MSGYFPQGDWARFARWVGLALVAYALLPSLWAVYLRPDDGLYLGYQTNLDDHMVYSAWMRQAQDFRFLFDNRFTTDPQPGLTVHVYFFVMGVVSKLTGLGLAASLSRAVFGFLSVMLLARLIELTSLSPTARKLGLVLATFGAGLGAVTWQAFGQAYERADAPFAGLTSNRLPVDVWQPEAFLFSSALTNGLFVFSLCLIFVVFLSALMARESWKPVLPGALGMLVLMNVHSYDVMIVSAVFAGLLASSASNRRLTPLWAARAVVIGLGAVPSMLWFVFVLTNDPVFQARAATKTYSPSFQALVFTLLPLGVAAYAFLASKDWKTGGGRVLGLGALGALAALLYFMAQGRDTNQFFLTFAAFAVCLAVALAASYLVAHEDDDAGNLILGWAAVSLVLPFAPFLFQRKLEMGLVIPWGVLAGGGLALLQAKTDPKLRRPLGAAATAVLCSCSLMWIVREFQYVQNNVSSTTMHSVFLSKDAAGVVAALEKEPGRRVVAAPPGQPTRLEGLGFNFAQPAMSDLNPVLSGLAGAYTYAGHWSETPRYDKRRRELDRLFFRLKEPADKLAMAKSLGLTHLVAPNPEAFPRLPLDDLRGLGQPVYEGKEFSLLRLK